MRENISKKYFAISFECCGEGGSYHHIDRVFSEIKEAIEYFDKEIKNGNLKTYEPQGGGDIGRQAHLPFRAGVVTLNEIKLVLVREEVKVNLYVNSELKGEYSYDDDEEEPANLDAYFFCIDGDGDWSIDYSTGIL